ncbi:MAG: OmpA family protein [Gammaproteobacteria bacterium]|jgi:outer membrane protein OmpA-like peptidoglycan-associated protein|nr:OmpA family protein [Gammaproteobacteria bacterium]
MKKSAYATPTPLAACIAAALLLNGCMTTDPYTGEKQATKSTAGATIGAVAGALLGAATSTKGDRKKAVLIGAGIGAIAGGGVGAYMDKQENKLRQQLQGSGVSVTREGNNIILNMPNNITFDFDSAQLKPEFHNTLNSVVLVLNEYKSTLITVKGHTDSTGTDDYNQKLSERRALAVGQYLQSKNVAQQRLAAVGYGETRPVASNNTPEGRAQNRRVELELEPITQ